MRRFLISFASLVSLVPVMVCAQGRGGAAGHVGGGGGFHAAAAPHATTHASAPGGGASHFIPGHYVRTTSGGVAFRPARMAGSGNLGVRASSGGRRVLSQDVVPIVPSFGAGGSRFGSGRGSRGPGRHFPFVAYFPFYGGGWYLPLYDDGYDDDTQYTDQDQAQAEAAPQDYYNGYPAPPRPGDTAEGLPESAPTPSVDTPERPADQYVFVRRDGTLFFAVAYTWVGSDLRYVTSEGLRRSVAGDTLDLSATQQFNEQRGLSFVVPTA
jgi:hypothetical protein